jgi:hypothetical protein
LGAAAPVGAGLAQGQAQAAQSNVGFLEKLAQMQQARNQAEMQRQLQTAQIQHLGAQQSLLESQIPKAGAQVAKTEEETKLKKAQQDAIDYLGSPEGQDVYARAKTDPKARALLTAKISAHPHAKEIIGQFSMTPYQSAIIDLGNRRANSQENKPTGQGALAVKDISQMRQLSSQAAPDVQTLTDWYGKNRNPNVAAQFGGKLPLVGNTVAATMDKDFANAQQAAHGLAWAYIESLPKGRPNPPTLAKVEALIAPDVGDTQAMRKQKLNRIQVFSNALQSRAQVNPLDEQD